MPRPAGKMHAFDVLGDPVRRRILGLLVDGEHNSGDAVAVIESEDGSGFGLGSSSKRYWLPLQLGVPRELVAIGPVLWLDLRSTLGPLADAVDWLSARAMVGIPAAGEPGHQCSDQLRCQRNDEQEDEHEVDHGGEDEDDEVDQPDQEHGGDRHLKSLKKESGRRGTSHPIQAAT